MKICVIGKFPPIQGGVSRDTLWTSVGLADRGHEVHVVTNADEVEDAYRLVDDYPGAKSIQALVEETPNLHVHNVDLDSRVRYIPYAKPYLSALTGLAIDVVRKFNLDIIYSYYFEPYGMAAMAASKATNVPYSVRHAGSDAGKLIKFRPLREAYTEMLREADFVFSSSFMRPQFRRIGVREESLLVPPQTRLRPGLFQPEGEALSPEQLQYLHERMCARMGLPVHNLREWHQFPTVGVLGKLGVFKGTFDLLDAVAYLKDHCGTEIKVLALAAGRDETISEVLEYAKSKDIDQQVALLSPIPHWEVPKFIRSCSSMAVLERKFPINLHMPKVAQEVIACQKPLLLSKEIAEKAVYSDYVSDLETVRIVDPENVQALAEAVLAAVAQIDVPAVEIQRTSHVEKRLKELTEYDEFLLQLEECVRQMLTTHRERRSQMAMAEMYAVLNRLYTSDTFLKLFELSQDLAIQNYSLTEEEKDTLAAVDRKVLRFFSQAVISKRLNRIKRSFPLVSQVTGAEYNQLAMRYNDIHPAIPGEDSWQDVVRFGKFLESSLSAMTNVVGYASDLAKHERLLVEIFQQEASDLIPAPSKSATGFITNPHIIIENFDYDIDEIITEMEAGRVLGEVNKQFSTYCYSLDAQGVPRISRMSEGMANIVSECSTFQTPDSVLESLGARSDDLSKISLGEITEAMEVLHTRGLLLSFGQER